jgi:hypothetical protein
MPVPFTPPTGAEGFGADIDEAEGATVGTGAMTIWAIVKLDGEVAVVVMALTGELLTGVAVTETSCVGGISCGVVSGGGAFSSVLPTKPSLPPSKSGGSCTAWKRTVVPKIATKITWMRIEIVKSRELRSLSINLTTKLVSIGDTFTAMSIIYPTACGLGFSVSMFGFGLHEIFLTFE